MTARSTETARPSRTARGGVGDRLQAQGVGEVVEGAPRDDEERLAGLGCDRRRRVDRAVAAGDADGTPAPGGLLQGRLEVAALLELDDLGLRQLGPEHLAGPGAGSGRGVDDDHQSAALGRRLHVGRLQRGPGVGRLVRCDRPQPAGDEGGDGADRRPTGDVRRVVGPGVDPRVADGGSQAAKRSGEGRDLLAGAGGERDSHGGVARGERRCRRVREAREPARHPAPGRPASARRPA